MHPRDDHMRRTSAKNLARPERLEGNLVLRAFVNCYGETCRLDQRRKVGMPSLLKLINKGDNVPICA